MNKRINTPISHGFSLLEMLIALLLISLVGGALYSLVNNQLSQFRHLQTIQTTLTYNQWLAQWSEGFTEQHQPQGSASVGSYTVRWHSELLTPPATITPDQRNSMYAMGGYFVGVYAVDAELYQQEQRLSSGRFIQAGSQPLFNGAPYPSTSSRAP